MKIGTEPREDAGYRPVVWVDPGHGDVLPEELRVQRGKVAVYVNEDDGSYELVQPQPDYPPDPEPPEPPAPAATGADAGTPGSWTPAGATPPADIYSLAGVTANPATPWTTAQYVVLGDGSDCTWSGTDWVGGRAPLS